MNKRANHFFFSGSVLKQSDSMFYAFEPLQISNETKDARAPEMTDKVRLDKITVIQYTCLNCLPEARSAEGEQFRQVYYDYIRT